jgi:hypothetical protein
VARVAGAEPSSAPPPKPWDRCHRPPSLPCPSIARIGNDRSAPADAAAVDKRLEELLAGIIALPTWPVLALLTSAALFRCQLRMRMRMRDKIGKGARDCLRKRGFGIPLELIPM